MVCSSVPNGGGKVTVVCFPGEGGDFSEDFREMDVEEGGEE